MEKIRDLYFSSKFNDFEFTADKSFKKKYYELVAENITMKDIALFRIYLCNNIVLLRSVGSPISDFDMRKYWHEWSTLYKDILENGFKII